MAHRSFSLTLTTASTAYNLLTLIKAVPGAVPTDGLLAYKVNQLEIQAKSDNGGTVTIADKNNSNTTGKILAGGDSMLRSAPVNQYYLGDFYLIGSADSQVVEVELDSI